MVNEGSAIESIIPFDSPKHPRLPYNCFPKGGRAGAVETAARVAWITGKYLYKYHRKVLAGALFIGGATSLFQGTRDTSRAPNNKFNKTRGRFRRRTLRRRKVCKCHMQRRPKRRYRNFQSRRR